MKQNSVTMEILIWNTTEEIEETKVNCLNGFNGLISSFEFVNLNLKFEP